MNKEILTSLNKFKGQSYWKFCKQFQNIHNDNYGLCLANSVDYFIDIGSCIGEVAYAAHKILKPIKTIAVEPSVKTFNFLKQNIGDIDTISLDNRAIYHTSNMVLCINEHPNNIGQNFISNHIIKNMDSCLSVTLEDLIIQHEVDLNSNIFIKIDCEGAEIFILDNPIIYQCQQISAEIHERQKDVKLFCDSWYEKITQTHNIIKGQRYRGKNYEIVFQKKS